MSEYCRDCGNTLCICKLINSNVSAEEHHKTYEELYFEALKVIGMAKQENEKLRKENEKLRECVESLIKATVFGVNQWQEAWSPNEETNAQKVIKQARQTLKELEK